MSSGLEKNRLDVVYSFQALNFKNSQRIKSNWIDEKYFIFTIRFIVPGGQLYGL